MRAGRRALLADNALLRQARSRLPYIAPTLYAASIDHSIVFRASRYEPDEAGEGDYLNIPLTREGYRDFVDSLLAAETVPLHRHEAELFFEGCLPIEEMARRGRDTLAYGPMKPVGRRRAMRHRLLPGCTTTSAVDSAGSRKSAREKGVSRRAITLPASSV